MSEIDEMALKAMFVKIYEMEAENIRTGRFDDKDMAKRDANVIGSLISGGVKVENKTNKIN